MPYRYLEEIATADIAFCAWGDTVEEMFISASDALLNIMVDNLEAVRGKREILFELEHEELDILLFNFLNEIVFQKDAQRLLLRVSSLTILSGDSCHRLCARAMGEELDRDRHRLLLDIKAVTLHRLNVRQTDRGWEATVVVDI